MESERYVAVSFSPAFGIIEFLFIKVNQNWLFAGLMRVTIMLRIMRVSLSIGWYNKIHITLSTVASSVTKLIKTTSKSSLYFDVLATNQRQKMILCLQLARMNLCLRYKNIEYGKKI